LEFFSVAHALWLKAVFYEVIQNLNFSESRVDNLRWSLIRAVDGLAAQVVCCTHFLIIFSSKFDSCDLSFTVFFIITTKAVGKGR
jgi:hypothetical protein